MISRMLVDAWEMDLTATRHYARCGDIDDADGGIAYRTNHVAKRLRDIENGRDTVDTPLTHLKLVSVLREHHR